MSERHSSAASFGRQVERVRGASPVQGRATDGHDAEYMRRYRAGRRGMVWSESRNGLPWKPYVYRGRGCGDDG